MKKHILIRRTRHLDPRATHRMRQQMRSRTRHVGHTGRSEVQHVELRRIKEASCEAMSRDRGLWCVVAIVTIKTSRCVDAVVILYFTDPVHLQKRPRLVRQLP